MCKKELEDIVKDFPEFIKECLYKDWNNNILKKCRKCKRELPYHSLFFNKNKNFCKECENSSFINTQTIRIFKKYVPDNMKYCSGCGKIHPATNDYFNRHKNSPDGFYSKCKICRGFKSYGESLTGINIKLSKENKKMCKYCGEIKDKNDFPKVRNTGVINAEYCKSCKYIENEKEKIRRNKEENKNKKSEYDKNYYKENKEKKLEYHKEWKSSERGRLLSRISDKERESRKMSLFSDLSAEQWKYALEYFEYCCAYCGIDEDEHFKNTNKVLAQEHIIPVSDEGMYTDFNIIPSCISCNSRKRDKELEDFYEREDYFTKERYLKIIDYLLDIFDKN